MDDLTQLIIFNLIILIVNCILIILNLIVLDKFFKH